MMWCKLTCCILYLYLYLYGGIVGVTEYNKLYNGCLPTVTSLRPTLQSGEIPTMHTMPTIPTIHMWLGKCQAMPTHVVKNISLFICFFFTREIQRSHRSCAHIERNRFFFFFKIQCSTCGREGESPSKKEPKLWVLLFQLPKIGGKAQVHLKRVVFVHSAVNCELCKGFNLWGGS